MHPACGRRGDAEGRFRPREGQVRRTRIPLDRSEGRRPGGVWHGPPGAGTGVSTGEPETAPGASVNIPHADSSRMREDPEQRRKTDEILEAIRREYGFVPVVNQVLSTRPDLFLPLGAASRAVLEGDGALERRQRYLCAVSAATAAGGEYCVEVQMRHALDAGCSEDEVLEAILIGSYMSMTRAQSYALRRYAAVTGIELEPTDGKR